MRRFTKYVARMGKMRNDTKFRWEILKGKRHSEKLGVICWDYVDWIHLAQDGDQ